MCVKKKEIIYLFPSHQTNCQPAELLLVLLGLLEDFE